MSGLLAQNDWVSANLEHFLVVRFLRPETGARVIGLLQVSEQWVHLSDGAEVTILQAVLAQESHLKLCAQQDVHDVEEAACGDADADADQVARDAQQASLEGPEARVFLRVLTAPPNLMLLT